MYLENYSLQFVLVFCKYVLPIRRRNWKQSLQIKTQYEQQIKLVEEYSKAVF